MKLHTRRVQTVLAEQWHGGEDEQVVADVRALGFTVLFQYPHDDQPTEEIWDDETNASKRVPSQSLMVIMGRHKWDTTYVEHSDYVTPTFIGDAGTPVEPDDFSTALANVVHGNWKVRIKTQRVKPFSAQFPTDEMDGI